MIQSIVQYLNLRLETLGRIADLHGISERRKRESDGANVPYCYVGSGEFKAVNIDNGNVGWWRPRGGFTMEPVEVIGRAVRQQRATYPLRFVAILRRELSTSDDAFMPSRLAEDIANALNFDNGDLRGILKAINVEARASGGEFDAATIWPTEFQTSIPDLRYDLAMVAVDVTVEVVGRYSCWEGECATDTDILHLFNFCDPSVVARLTDAQRVCLEAAICPTPEDANWELFNTEGTLLETGSIPSGDTDSIVAPDATVLINGTQVDTVASGDAIDLPVVNNGSNPVGSEQSGEWVIGNSTVTINGTQVGDIVAEDSLPIAVELDGNPSGTWNAGTQTWEVTSPPCADGLLGINGNAGLVSVPSGGTANVEVQQGGVNVGSWNGTRWIVPPCAPATFSIDGTQVDTIASGADLDVSVELNGSPVTPTYNSGTKVIGVTGGVSGSISVAVSNATPTFGQSITITATPTGFTPTNYIFFAYDGSDITWVAEQAGASVNWTVSVVGAFEVYALGTDGALEVYGLTNVTAASSLVCDSIATAPVAGFSVARRLSINYLGDAMLIRRSSDNATLSIGFIGEAVDTAAITTFVGANNAFTATIFNQFGATNAQQVTAANQPTIVVTGTIQTLGGRPTVVFDGSTDEMTIASSITAVHGFTVARKASNANLLQYLLGGNGHGMNFGGTFGGFTSILISSAGGSLISGVDNTLPHQVTFRMGAAGAGRLRVDGALTASGTTSANLVISRIGTREDVAFRHIGSFSELILYSSALSDADQSVIESNQISYYGI